MRTEHFLNPFSVTKATEFSDQQIKDYWVDYNFKENKSIISLLNPTEFTPKYLIGGKGCGKTHILRYFSYPIQRLRADGNVVELLLRDKYIGIYSLLNGLDTSRFAGKGIDDSQWSSVYEYYFELFVCGQLISVLKDAFTSLGIDKESEANFISKSVQIFLTKPNVEVNTLVEFESYLSSLRKSIDLEILNASYLRKLNYENVKILFSPGNLIYGIPKLLEEASSHFKDVKIIYMLDEYEKLFEWQKEFINTVVWEKQNPATIWVGSRKYGFTTTLTKTGEKLKPNSEYKPVVLDGVFREQDNFYTEFAKKLCENRLIEYCENKANVDFSSFLINKFEKFDLQRVLDDLILKSKKKDLKHFANFRESIKKAIQKKLILDNEVDIENLIESIKNDCCNPLEEKYKLRIIYQAWANANTSVNISKIVEEANEEFKKYKEGQLSDFENTIEKYKSDLLVQLLSENNIKNYSYLGYDDFISISWGNPRVLLSILKDIFEKSDLKGERPLEKGTIISLETQYLGLYKTSKWFYDDAEIIGEEGKNIYKSIWNLADILRLYRFSDRMTETSVSSFSFKIEEVSEEANRFMTIAENHSFLIEVESGRKQRNSGSKQKVYQLNKILAPLWDLPIVRRSVTEVSSELIEAIFTQSSKRKFDAIYKEVKEKYSAPFINKTKKKKQENILPENSLFPEF